MRIIILIALFSFAICDEEINTTRKARFVMNNDDFRNIFVKRSADVQETTLGTATTRKARLVMNNQGAMIQNQQGNDFTGLFGGKRSVDDKRVSRLGFQGAVIQNQKESDLTGGLIGKRSVDDQETTLGTGTTRKARLVMNNQGAVIKNQQGNDFSGLFGGKRSVDGQETTVSTGTTRKARLVMNNQGAMIKNQQGNDFSGLFGGKRSIDIKKQINNQGGEPEMMRVSQDPFGGKRSFDNMDNELLKQMGNTNQAGVSQDLFGRKRSVGSGAEKTENSRESRGTVNNQGSQIGNQNVADFGNLVGGFFDN